MIIIRAENNNCLYWVKEISITDFFCAFRVVIFGRLLYNMKALYSVIKTIISRKEKIIVTWEGRGVITLKFIKNYSAFKLNSHIINFPSPARTLNGLFHIIFCNNLLIWLHLIHSHIYDRKEEKTFFHVLIYSIQGWI